VIWRGYPEMRVKTLIIACGAFNAALPTVVENVPNRERFPQKD
jgi:hypothetical protein